MDYFFKSIIGLYIYIYIYIYLKIEVKLILCKCTNKIKPGLGNYHFRFI